MECVRSLYKGKRLSKALPEVLEHMGRFLEADRVYIFIMRDGFAYNEFEWCADGIASQKDELQGVDMTAFKRWMTFFNRQECMILTDIEQLRETDYEEYEFLKAQDIRSLIAAPLERNGAFAGCLGVDNPPPENLNHITSLLQTLGYFLMLAYRRSEDEEQLSHLSYHDTLTSFYNRNRYIEDSRTLQSANVPIGVVYLDVNGLKDINDLRGHAYGDLVLKKCSDLMRAAFDAADFYRIGGDEFVIICRGIGETDFIERIAELKNRFKSDSICRAAIGSQWSEQLTDISQVTADADAMMYEDKKEYYRRHPVSNRYRHQSDELVELSKPEVLEAEINRNRFVVYMQPKISSTDRTTIGAEALIRYQSREGSLILPGNFLPLLEETQTISQIDFFVFEFVCSRIKKWVDVGKQTIPVSINFSNHSLAQPNFVEQLSAICKKYSISSSFLEVEITESARNVSKINLTDLIAKLRSAGFIVTLSDFGIGDASLSMLTSVEFDVLKLDKTLVDVVVGNPKTQAVIESIASICDKTGVHLVAEGIETEEQMEVLRKCGVRLVQGFLFSKPIPIEEYEEKYL